MLFSIDMDQQLPASGASITTNMHTYAAMDMEQLFGVYGGVIGEVLVIHPGEYNLWRIDSSLV
jgi:hypothetical protein